MLFLVINILLMLLDYGFLCGMLYESEQDEDLEKLEVTVVSTKHIALAVNEELDLHTRLIVCVSPHHIRLAVFSFLIFESQLKSST